MIKFYLLKIIRRVIFLFYLFKKTNFKGLTFNNNAELVIWAPIFSWKYFIRDRILMDFAHINSLSNQGKKFNLFFKKDIGKFYSKKIFIAYDFEQNIFSFNDYTRQLSFIIDELEKQNNIVFPSSKEYQYWENKQYMHEMFNFLKIPHPKTQIINSKSNLDVSSLKYPFLIKEVHSCQSNGVFKIENLNQLNELKIKDSVFLVQELLNMRRDIRVTIVGNEIVHFYWRINNQTDWMPTSTGKGSSVDFENFPEKWRNFIINEFLKMNLVTGALDIAWENDDLNTKPLILEISPTYQLNPKTSNINFLNEYGKYKKYSMFGNESYLSQYITQTFDIVTLITKKRLS